MIESRKLREIKKELSRIGVVVCSDDVCIVRTHDGKEIRIEFDPDSPIVYIESWCAVMRGGFGTAMAKIDDVPVVVSELDSICRSFETLINNWDINEVFKKMQERKDVEIDTGIQLVAVYPRTVVMRTKPSNTYWKNIRLFMGVAEKNEDN